MYLNRTIEATKEIIKILCFYLLLAKIWSITKVNMYQQRLSRTRPSACDLDLGVATLALLDECNCTTSEEKYLKVL